MTLDQQLDIPVTVRAIASGNFTTDAIATAAGEVVIDNNVAQQTITVLVSAQGHRTMGVQ